MSESPTAMRIPETMGPDEIGPYLRELREHFKLTPQDVSERLHIRVRYVTAMEEGRYDAMPGKVYARGYIHTYAEFLGLDADQVLAQCFAPGSQTAEVKAEKPTPVLPKPTPARLPEFKPTPPPLMRDRPRRSPLRGLVMLAMLGAAIWGAMQFDFAGDEPPMAETSTVAEIPESLLASVRSVVMPTAGNYHCLSGSLLLSCFFAGDSVEMLRELTWGGGAARPYLQRVDLERAAREAPVAAPAEPDENAGND